MEGQVLNTILKVENLNVYYGDFKALSNVSIEFYQNQVHAIMGPSGCGKSTMIRCFNRMHELIPGTKVEGKILLHGEDLLSLNPMLVRRKTGMVFQKPNPFPNMSVYDNVIAGYKLNGVSLKKSEADEIVEDSLKKAGLWNEVKDKLFKKGTFLSGGQQQRLCIARALALHPEVLLLDEPTSSLDPKSTAHIEELIVELKKNVTIILVTHNIGQAGRVSNYTAFMYLGELIEYGPTEKVFTVPSDKRTEEYLGGKFG
ncbi:MAG: phosphate ABC transporter ATP-binding protein PstB [Brevinematia bacterium]